MRAAVLIIASLAALGAAPGGRGLPTKGDKMPNTVAEYLNLIPPMDVKRLDSLAQAIRIRGLEETEQAVQLSHSKDKELAGKAGTVVDAIGPLSIGPMLQALNNNDPLDCANEMQTIVDLELRQRQSVAGGLKKFLDDKTPIPTPPRPKNVEELPPKQRICDVAYLQMRRLMHREPEAERMTNESLFNQMKEPDRDKEIKNLKEKGAYGKLEDYFPGDEPPHQGGQPKRFQ